MTNFNELIFSDPNLAEDFKNTFQPLPELGNLSPEEQLLKEAEKAFAWYVEFSSKFTAQKEFLEDNLMQQFPGVELQKAIKRVREQ